MTRFANFRTARRLLAGLAVSGAAASAALAAGATAAHAQSYTTLNASSSFMAIDVSGGATWAGAPVIQWYDDGGANQHWSVPGNGATGLVQNQNSGMCLWTNGVPGSQLVQEPCDPTNPYEQWTVGEQWTLWGDAVELYNPSFGLQVDVYGNSYSAGAAIDAWYPNNGANQFFYEDGAN